MARITLAVIRAIKRSQASDADVLAAIESASEPKPAPKKDGKYKRRDMQAEK